MDTKLSYENDKQRQGYEKFYTKNKELTDYALVCGYVQLHTAEDGTQVRLDKPSPGGSQYDVRVWPPGYYDRTHPNWVWDAFDTLSQARKRYRKLVRKHP
jgi:hypothetical protein